MLQTDFFPLCGWSFVFCKRVRAWYKSVVRLDPHTLNLSTKYLLLTVPGLNCSTLNNAHSKHMLDLSGTSTLESSENKQDLTSAIRRCLPISVVESSASVITAAFMPAEVTLPGTIYSSCRLGIKFHHENILRLGNARDVFCLSPSLALIFSAVSKIGFISSSQFNPGLRPDPFCSAGIASFPRF